MQTAKLPPSDVEGNSGRTVSPRDVIDGDTVRLRGQTFRLVGFDTPETGRNAQCAYERELGNAATARLQSLIRTAANADLTPVQCSCRPGTHGTVNATMGAIWGHRLQPSDTGALPFADRVGWSTVYPSVVEAGRHREEE